jgi:hypothetical protein
VLDRLRRTAEHLHVCQERSVPFHDGSDPESKKTGIRTSIPSYYTISKSWENKVSLRKGVLSICLEPERCLYHHILPKKNSFIRRSLQKQRTTISFLIQFLFYSFAICRVHRWILPTCIQI